MLFDLLGFVDRGDGRQQFRNFLALLHAAEPVAGIAVATEENAQAAVHQLVRALRRLGKKVAGVRGCRSSVFVGHCLVPKVFARCRPRSRCGKRSASRCLTKGS
jgi:hypothetical protein